MADEWKPRSEYARKLQDPRWQKRRLEILTRDNFQCQSCGDCRSMLSVHHVEYAPRDFEDMREPWDYPDDMLVVLCGLCHETEHAYALQSARFDLILQLSHIGIRTAHDLDALTQSLTLDGAWSRQQAGDPNPWAGAMAAALLRFRVERDEAIAAGEWFRE